MKFADFQTASFFENPYPVYATLRAEGSIVPIASNMVMTGHYDIVDALLHDRRAGKAYLDSVRARYGEAAPEQPVFQSASRMMFAINPPVHTPLRSLMMKAFNARQIGTMREIAHTTANELVDAMTKDDGADLMASYALPMPIHIICRMLDIPVEDARVLGDATRQMSRVLDAVPIPIDELEGPNEACSTLEQYFADVIEARRKKPGDDLISLLLSIEENGVSMSAEDIIANVMLLFGAGHETTSNLLGNSLLALHRHPEQLHALRRHPDRIAPAVFECARYDTSVQSTVRTALEDIEIGGATIPRGTTILLMLGSANRDPAKFNDPDRLDIGRDDARLISFGAGIHHCLGYRLALLELEISLSVLLERLPRLHLTNLDDLQWRRHGNLRGVTALHARW
jgi:cytochrome P450